MVKSREMFTESPREIKLRTVSVGEGPSCFLYILHSFESFQKEKTRRVISQDDHTILVLSQEEDVKCVFEGTWVRVVSTGGVFCVLSLSVAFP